jgi:hypothetical protein
MQSPWILMNSGSEDQIIKSPHHQITKSPHHQIIKSPNLQAIACSAIPAALTRYPA